MACSGHASRYIKVTFTIYILCCLRPMCYALHFVIYSDDKLKWELVIDYIISSATNVKTEKLVFRRPNNRVSDWLANTCHFAPAIQPWYLRPRTINLTAGDTNLRCNIVDFVERLMILTQYLLRVSVSTLGISVDHSLSLTLAIPLSSLCHLTFVICSWM